ncbi:hypothetical protein [Flavobacterium pedocola]
MFPFAAENAVRFPTLFSHYSHHTQEYNENDFIVFLKDHYFGSHHEEEHEEHEKLPFHHHGDLSIFQVLAISSEQKYFKQVQRVYYQKPGKIIFYKDDFQPNVLLYIWKPPKIA